MERPFAQLYPMLGHSFLKPDLLTEALTHTSATEGEGKGKRNYERLEFLGDRVLGLVISGLLLERFPDEKVGELARRHTALVRSEALTRVATKLGLGTYVQMSPSDEENGAKENPQTLADCCEAVIGALYLDGGLVAAEKLIGRYWSEILDEAVAPPKDPKTALQEWAQGRGLPLPVYSVIDRAGPPHEPVFTIQCAVRGMPSGTATGRSKRAAEQGAAQRVMRVIRAGESTDITDG